MPTRFEAIPKTAEEREDFFDQLENEYYARKRKLTDEERLKVFGWLERRKEVGKTIDPETAEVAWLYGQVLDPYGVWPDLLDEEQCVGRMYFARNPGGAEWVHFGDLPGETHQILWEKHRGKLAFPVGLPPCSPAAGDGPVSPAVGDDPVSYPTNGDDPVESQALPNIIRFCRFAQSEDDLAPVRQHVQQLTNPDEAWLAQQHIDAAAGRIAWEIGWKPPQE